MDASSKKTAFALIVMGLGALGGGGVASADDMGPVIGELRVEGNARTQTDVILRAAEVSPGSHYAEDLPDRVRQRVYNLRVFDTVAVLPERHGDAVDLMIHVTERWTLLPIPFASASGDIYRVGAFLVDSNFIGRHKTAVAGGYYGNHGSGGFIYYQDPELNGTQWQTTLQASYFGAVRERFQSGMSVDAFHERRAEAFWAIGYRIAHTVTLLPGWFITDVRLDAQGGYPMPTVGSGFLEGPTLTVDLDASDFRLYFQAGVQNHLHFESSLAGAGAARSYLRVTDRFQAATRLLWDHALIVQADFAYGTSAALPDIFLLGGQTGSRGFHTQGLWAQRMATAALEYHVPVWRPSWGIWTVLGFVDAGALDGPSGRMGYVQPGAGFRMFLRQIALPALGVDVAYSLDEHSLWLGVSAGLQL